MAETVEAFAAPNAMDQRPPPYNWDRKNFYIVIEDRRAR